MFELTSKKSTNPPCTPSGHKGDSCIIRLKPRGSDRAVLRR